MCLLLQDSIARSAIKGLCWRVFSTLLTIVLVLVVLRGSVNVSSLMVMLWQSHSHAGVSCLL